MIYILIYTAYISSGSATHSIEFNTREACQAAQQEMLRQRKNDFPVLFCAAKGEKK